MIVVGGNEDAVYHGKSGYTMGTGNLGKNLQSRE
jgi:hypothetical protein